MAHRIALIGPPGTGKSTIADAWAELVGGRRLSFARGLKEEVATAITVASDWKAYSAEGLDAASILRKMQDPTTKDQYRALLQAWGSFRRARDPEYWIHPVLRRIAAAGSDVPLAIDDCRYDNEAEALRLRGFLLVRLEPGETTRELKGAQAAHESERDWPAWEPDIVLPYVPGPRVQARILAAALDGAPL